MRLSRDQFFDLLELVGKAVVTARNKPADGSWLVDLAPRWILERQREEGPKEDVYGLFSGTPWVSESLENDSEYEYSAVERNEAERAKRAFGDTVSCQLWNLDREVRFRRISVTEGMTQLMELCRRLAKHFISRGWANSLVRIIDRASH